MNNELYIKTMFLLLKVYEMFLDNKNIFKDTKVQIDPYTTSIKRIYLSDKIVGSLCMSGIIRKTYIYEDENFIMIKLGKNINNIFLDEYDLSTLSEEELFQLSLSSPLVLYLDLLKMIIRSMNTNGIFCISLKKENITKENVEILESIIQY